MISIIIPALEEADYLPLLLKDLKAQSIHPDEIIVVDAGSKDKTAAIARSGGAIVIHSGKRNQSYQRNLGARRAKGDAFLFIDADIRLPDLRTFQEAVYILKSHVAATARVDVIRSERTFLDRMLLAPSNLCARLFPRLSGRGAFLAVRGDAFADAGGFDESLIVTEDLDFFRRVARIGSVACLKARVEESPRRYRRLGRSRVLWAWFSNALFAAFLGRSKDEEWTAVR